MNKAMNDKFDELAKGLAQSVTRRSALKKFGVGLAGVALASLGLANHADAHAKSCGEPCDCSNPNSYWGCCPWQKACIKQCSRVCGG
jgi:hypothetical protein